MIEIAHLASTLFMGGVIVFVQVVHYPLMARVGRDDFAAYQGGHTARTSWVVVPAMSIELATAVWLAVQAPDPATQRIAFAGLGLLALIWTSTAVLQAPAHGRLTLGFDEGVHRRLVATNWLRTFAWLARAPLAVALTV